MAARTLGGTFPSQLKILSRLGVVGDLSDGQLLHGCLNARDGRAEVAFTALVERHGPMVLSVCRGILGNSHDVDDAFQATFLLLFRKAGSIRNADSVASWLHGVAVRVCGRARSDEFARKRRERRGAEMRALMTDRDADRCESWPELHEEIALLPARYQEPLVLCCLEGLTTEAAARRLRCPQGTVLSRLSRARERLRTRLIRRGWASAPRLGDNGLPSETAPASVPAPLLNGTVHLIMQLLEGQATTGLITAPVAALAEGVLRNMFWSKLAAGGLVALALAGVVVGAAAALEYQEPAKEVRGAAPQKIMQERPTSVSKAVETVKPTDSSVMIVAMPSREELQRLLRRASAEGRANAKDGRALSSWCLNAIAGAQAKTGDMDGARTTFAEAANAAAKGLASGIPWNLWRIGHAEAECGLKAEARATFERAVRAVPGATGDYQLDSQVIRGCGSIVQDQAQIGAREDAIKSSKLLLEFSKKFVESSKFRNARVLVAPDIAAALAAIGDFEAAFGWSENVENPGNVLGTLVDAAAKSLDREAARRFVREAADRLARMNSVREGYMGLSGLAEAQARVGDVEAARQSARAIGVGINSDGYDMTDGQPYAFIRVASVQRQAGDTAGARETLREAYRAVRDNPKMRGRDGRYGQVARGQVANGDIGDATITVGAMSGQRSDSLAFLALAQAAAGEHGTASRTFARALEDAGLTVKNPPSPNPEFAGKWRVSQNMPAQARMQLAKIQAMAGDVPGALVTVRSIDDQNYRRSALGAVVTARATAGDVANALRLCLDEPMTPEQRLSALQGLGDGVRTRLSLKSLDRVGPAAPRQP